MPIDALSVLCAQLTRDLLAIAKFLFTFISVTGFLTNTIGKIMYNVCSRNYTQNQKGLPKRFSADRKGFPPLENLFFCKKTFAVI